MSKLRSLVLLPAALLVLTACALTDTEANAGPTLIVPPVQLESPADVALVPGASTVLVADSGNDRIVRFDADGRYRGQFGSAGSRAGELQAPTAVAADSRGYIWVGDAGNHRIQKFTSRGRFVLQRGGEGERRGQFSVWGPKDIAVDRDDNVWVSDYSGRIQMFSASGKFQMQIKLPGSERGPIESAGIDIGSDGRIWVTEWKATDRVSVFADSGALLFSFGSAGPRPNRLSQPDAISVDRNGVWILDEGNSRIAKFDRRGAFQGAFGAQGIGVGQFQFDWPGGLSSDGRGAIWVTDTGNDRLQRIGAGRFR